MKSVSSANSASSSRHRSALGRDRWNFVFTSFSALFKSTMKNIGEMLHPEGLPVFG